MQNKIDALEVMIKMVIDAAADADDLTAVMELLYKEADALDRKILEIEENF